MPKSATMRPLIPKNPPTMDGPLDLGRCTPSAPVTLGIVFVVVYPKGLHEACIF